MHQFGGLVRQRISVLGSCRLRVSANSGTCFTIGLFDIDPSPSSHQPARISGTINSFGHHPSLFLAAQTHNKRAPTATKDHVRSDAEHRLKNKQTQQSTITNMVCVIESDPCTSDG